jgi:hypothetical protein
MADNSEALVVGAGLLAALLLAGRRTVPAAAPAAPSVTTAPPASSTGGAVLATTAPTITTLTAPQPTGLAASPPASASSGAPTVTNLEASRDSSGIVTLTWQGTLQAVWNGADNEGYDLFEQAPDGSWQVLQSEVEPPLRIQGVPSGTVLGIAPVYLTPDGRIISGAISAVTV